MGQGVTGSSAYSNLDYTDVLFDEKDVELRIIPDPIGGVRPFRAVATAEELQEAMRRGTNHILITAHLDATEVTPERDLEMREVLDNAVGRVLNTTLSISVRDPIAMY